MEIINIGGQISSADFGQFSFGVYNCKGKLTKNILMEPLFLLISASYLLIFGKFPFKGRRF
jgi:hypothetical protein